jgi:membrane-associated phospholipid phosphatase
VNVCINTNLLDEIKDMYMEQEHISQFFSSIGENGPFILYFLSLFMLWNKQTLFAFYNIGFVANILLNIVLKGIFKQPRPFDNLSQFHLAMKTGKRFIFKDGFYYDIFGMPSGHAESVFYSITFLFMSLQHLNCFFLFCLISFITMAQRVIFQHHTLFQVFIGAIVGMLIGYSTFYFSQQNIKGDIREKPDDDSHNV